MVKSAKLALAAVSIVLGCAVAACNQGLGGFSGNVGNTPPVPAQTSFRVLGNPGTAFTATISDARQSWTIQGAIPMSVAIMNNLPPVRMVATKLANDSSLLSLNIVNGVKLVAYSSTTAPFGTASVQVGKLAEFAPAASPDVRITVGGPAAQLFRGLVEDSEIGFEVEERAPAVFLFDSPNGSVDGQFFQLQNFGSFDVNLTLNGGVVATVSGGPTVSIKQP